MKILLLDTVGPPYDMTKPLGGAAVAPVVMVDELLGRGHDVTIMRQDPTNVVECDALIVNRYSPIPPTIHARKTVVWAHEFADGRHDIHRGQTFVCVSGHQAEGFKRLSPAARIHIIPPMLGRHVKRQGHFVLGVWLYASAEDKGLDDSLAAWVIDRPAGASKLLVCTRDYDDEASVRKKCAGVPDVVWMPPRSPVGVVNLMSGCEGLFYHERAAEAFPVTVAIAKHLGMMINHKHVGHTSCGFDEAMTSDMRPEVVCEQWERILSNG